MKIAFGVVLMFAARFIVQAMYNPHSNADIYWQRWLGDRILQTGHLPFALGSETAASAGAPWVPQEWALSIAIALASHAHAFLVLALIATAAGAAVLLITAAAAKRLGASDLAVAICVVCTGFAIYESFGVRAQTFGWIFIALFFYVLRCTGGKAHYWLLPITVLWANLHASAMLAPVLMAVWTLGTLLDERGFTPAVKQSLVLTAGCAASLCATPLGLRLPLYAIQLFTSPIRHGIVEWQPADLAAESFTFGLLPLLAGACVLGMGKRRDWLIFIACTWLALEAVRNISVAAVIIAPVLAVRLTDVLPERLRINQLLKERGIAILAYAAFVPCTFVIFTMFSSGLRAAARGLPEHAMIVAAAQPGMHRIYCDDWAWCSLALAHANMQEFMDGRCDPFPLEIWKEYDTITRVKPQWRYLLAQRGIDEVLARRSGRLAKALRTRAEWHAIYADKRYQLFIREDGGERTAYYQRKPEP